MILSLCACASNWVRTTSGHSNLYTEINDINVFSRGDFRVAVLLPLTGEFAKQGNGLKNATMMALEDVNDDHLVLQYYDTKGTPEGASIAVTNALNQDAQLIIGPMLSTSVQAIAPAAKRKGVPVIAFTSTSDVLQEGVYTMGLLLDEQVDRIMTYAARHNRSRFALLVPDNTTGIASARAALKSAVKNNVSVTAIGFYKPGTTDFTDLLRKMTRYDARTAQLEQEQRKYSSAAANGDANAIRMMNKLKKLDSYGDIGFDAVLIPDGGASLKSAVAMFGYYDVFSPEVKFIGTSIWDSTPLNKESTMRGSWYPALTNQNSAHFTDKYAQIFGEKPSSLYAFGYNAVALASAISRNGTDNLDSKIVNPEGYLGVNGVFRFFANGFNQHSLDIKEVQSNGNYVVEAGVRKFGFDYGISHNSPLSGVRPTIYGKNQNTAEALIYGATYTSGGQAY